MWVDLEVHLRAVRTLRPIICIPYQTSGMCIIMSPCRCLNEWTFFHLSDNGPSKIEHVIRSRLLSFQLFPNCEILDGEPKGFGALATQTEKTAHVQSQQAESCLGECKGQRSNFDLGRTDGESRRKMSETDLRSPKHNLYRARKQVQD